MAKVKSDAVLISDVLTVSSITGNSPMHEALRQAQIAENAQLIEAFAQIAGICLDDVAARVAPDDIHAEADAEPDALEAA